MGRALRLGQARAPSAAAISSNKHKTQLKNMYFFRVRLRQFLGRALRLGQARAPRLEQARGPGAAARTG